MVFSKELSELDKLYKKLVMERRKVKKFCCSLPAYQYSSVKYIADKMGSDVSSILDSCVSFTLAMEPEFRKLADKHDEEEDAKDWKKEYLKLQKEEGKK